MARTTITQITDDLDGSKDATEVAFSYDGTDYRIDLGKKNQAAFEKALQPYLEAATKVPRRTRATAARRPASGKQTGPDPAAVREWAQANGVEVSERGRVAKSVVEQYLAANS